MIKPYSADFSIGILNFLFIHIGEKFEQFQVETHLFHRYDIFIFTRKTVLYGLYQFIHDAHLTPKKWKVTYILSWIISS